MLVVSEVETLSKRLAYVDARRLVDVVADRLVEEQVDTLYETVAKIRPRNSD